MAKKQAHAVETSGLGRRGGDGIRHYIGRPHSCGYVRRFDHDAGSVDVANGSHCRARDFARYVRCASFPRTGHYSAPR